MAKPKQTDTAARAKRKAEAAEVALRVEEVLRIRLDGAQYHDVVQYAAEKGWDLKERQIREYMARAGALLVERQEKKRRPLVAQHVARREALYARAVNGSDHRTALAVLDSLAKLQGLSADAKDLKELARLAAEQGARIRELEARLETAQRHPGAAAAGRPETRPAGGGDPGRAGGTTGGVQGGPDPSHG